MQNRKEKKTKKINNTSIKKSKPNKWQATQNLETFLDYTKNQSNVIKVIV
jgi:hypothetical protein